MIQVKRIFYYLGIAIICVLALAVLIQSIWIIFLSRQVSKLHTPGRKLTNAEKSNNPEDAAKNLLQEIDFNNIPVNEND